MKKILILSYHFPPQNNIASRRSVAYAEYLMQSNIYPTIVTHEFTGDGYPVVSNEIKSESFGSYTVVRTPYMKTYIGKFQKKVKRVPWLLNLFNMCLWSLGHLDSEQLDSYLSYRKFLRKHLVEHQYDLVLAIYSPSHHIRSAYAIHKKFGIPYVVDYRDLWDNGLLRKTSYKPSIGRKVLNYFSKLYHRKWLRKALFITSVSQPLVDYLKHVSGLQNCYLITNGFEASIFNSLQKKESEKFQITHGGTIYNDQDMKHFIQGIRFFYDELKAEDRGLFQILIIGSRNQNKVSQIKEGLADVQIEVSERLNRSEALQLMKNSSILYYPAFTSHRGIYSGKIFEYLGLGNNILVTPTDSDVVEELMRHTDAGIATSDPRVVARFLKENFEHWRIFGHMRYKGNSAIINEYSREVQVSKMAVLINNFLEDK